MAAQRDSILRQSPHIFNNKTDWDGISVRHSRMPSGAVDDQVSSRHQIFIVLAGSFNSSMVSATGRRRSGWRSSGHTPIIPAGQSYSAYWEEDIEDVTIYLDHSFLARAAAEGLISDKFELIESCSADDPVIRRIGMALKAEVESEGPAGRLYAESLANVLAVHLLRHYTQDSDRLRTAMGGLTGRKLNLATEFIEDNIERDLGITEIADAVDLSPFHFARSFKQATGVSPHQYLIKSRIERAKSLLAKSELPIVEVGFRVGFKNQSHFTTLFRRVTHLTPKAYRDITRR
ncbi:MAG TPA: AraC family transcriptional regulator [Blastocatellia bacterium]|nr:AraC family transcriptional regulator [Blastocatellia bacterium]